MIKEREFVYAGDHIPEITEEEHPDFILHYQKSVLLALVKRELLTPAQCDSCIDELKRRRGVL